MELSYLTSEEPVALLDAMDSEQSTPSLSQAQRLKKFSQEGRLSEDVMRAILSEEKKPEVGKITLSSDKLRRYFPKSYTPQQMEQTIFRPVSYTHLVFHKVWPVDDGWDSVAG